jgi:hypothetical protein
MIKEKSKIKEVKPVDMAQEAREYTRSKMKMQVLQNFSTNKRTIEIVYKAMEDLYYKTNESKEILDIMEAAKEINFEALVEKCIDFMESDPDRLKIYEEHKRGFVSDHSGASDQDNR